MIAAMNLGVAVLAGPPDDARTLSSSQQRTSGRLAVAVERAVVPHRQVVALLAEVGTRRHEQLVMVRPMRLMAVDATLADGRVLPEERPSLLGVAGVADLVDRVGVQQGARGRAMRVVAVDARQLS